MKVSEWRPALSGWLEQTLAVTSYLLVEPSQVGQLNLHLPPLSEVSYGGDSQGQLRAEAQQHIFIQLRYPDTPYSQLPVHAVEAFYQTLAVLLMRSWSSIMPDLVDCNMLSQDQPVEARELADGEWLVTLHWTLQLTYTAVPETVPGLIDDPTGGTGVLPYPLEVVSVGLHKSPLSAIRFVPRVLDANLTIQQD